MPSAVNSLPTATNTRGRCGCGAAESLAERFLACCEEVISEFTATLTRSLISANSATQSIAELRHFQLQTLPQAVESCSIALTGRGVVPITARLKRETETKD